MAKVAKNLSAGRLAPRHNPGKVQSAALRACGLTGCFPNTSRIQVRSHDRLRSLGLFLGDTSGMKVRASTSRAFSVMVFTGTSSEFEQLMGAYMEKRNPGAKRANWLWPARSIT